MRTFELYSTGKHGVETVPHRRARRVFAASSIALLIAACAGESSTGAPNDSTVPVSDEAPGTPSSANVPASNAGATNNPNSANNPNNPSNVPGAGPTGQQAAAIPPSADEASILSQELPAGTILKPQANSKLFSPTAEAAVGNFPPALEWAACETVQPAERTLRLLTVDEALASLNYVFNVNISPVGQDPGYTRSHGFTDARQTLVTGRHHDYYSKLATQVADAYFAKGDNPSGCDLSQAGCQDQFIREFGRSMFRRPLSDEEQGRYKTLFANDVTGGSAKEGGKAVITAMTVSPLFLYRKELGQNGNLTNYELATALSFHFLGRTPSNDLLDRAASNGLNDPASLRTAAESMLETDEFRGRLRTFARSWLHLDRLGSAKDTQLYPNYSALQQGMGEEAEKFVEEVFLDPNGDFANLFTPDFTWAGDAIADFYGTGRPGSQEPRRVSLNDTSRGGLLRMASTIAAYSDMQSINPVKIGAFIREAFQCQNLPQPEGLDIEPVAFNPDLALRDRYNEHAQGACATCHVFIDPMGFAFEVYDATGGYRPDAVLSNPGAPAVGSGRVVGFETLLTGDDTQEFEFSNLQELSAAFAQSRNVQACVALQYWRFALGRLESDAEQCELTQFQRRFVEGGANLRELLLDIVSTPSFTQRR